VPQISVVCGTSAGGGAYAPALTDFVVLTGRGRMFLTGPAVVRAALGEEVTMEELGGADVQGRNGVAQLTVDDDGDAIALVRELLGLLPQQIGGPSPRIAAVEAEGDPSAPVPTQSRKVYDVRDVAAAIVDGGRLLELAPAWAKNMVTALGRVEGGPVGLIANQPRSVAGVIDADAAEKAALFVERCARFGLPLIVLVDTPGFMPGLKQEAAGVIRRGAELLRAFAAAGVPKLTVVLRKAYGGAAIAMNSRDLGADLVLAWPGAEIGIMAADQAVEIVHRRRLEAGRGLRESLCDAYREQHLSARAAAASGFVDEVIEPSQTRDRLAWALGWAGEAR
jgi:acetyl-CoA carboxylase carboxyltransferase component